MNIVGLQKRAALETLDVLPIMGDNQRRRKHKAENYTRHELWVTNGASTAI